MYPRIPWELVADALRSVERNLGTTAMKSPSLPSSLFSAPELVLECGCGKNNEM